MKNDPWHICREANVISEQACLDAYRRAHQLSGSNSQPTTSAALWAYWWLTNPAQRFSTYRVLSQAISVTAYQTVCHKPVYHPFPKLRQVSSSNCSVQIRAHANATSPVGWTAACNSGQNYSPRVFGNQHSHVGLEVQLLTLKASLRVALEELFTKATFSLVRSRLSLQSAEKQLQ